MSRLNAVDGGGGHGWRRHDRSGNDVGHAALSWHEVRRMLILGAVDSVGSFHAGKPGMRRHLDPLTFLRKVCLLFTVS